MQNFYSARKKTKNRTMREMDKIALVREDHLNEAILKQSKTVLATVIHEDGSTSTQNIPYENF